MKIVSKRHPYRFYLFFILINVFFLGFIFFLIALSSRNHNNTGYFVGLLFSCILISLNFALLTNCPKIVLNKKDIFLKNEFYKWEGLISSMLLIPFFIEGKMTFKVYLILIGISTFWLIGRQPYTLRIITKDFKSKAYPASSLSDQAWLDMKKELESKKVRVRNDSIYLTL